MARPYQKFIQLRRAIQDAGYEDKEFAQIMGESPHWLSNRLAGRTPWQVGEALLAMSILNLPMEDFYVYFKDAAPSAVPMKKAI